MRPLRIAMFYELFWPTRGGIESWIANVSRELESRGHEVDIITGAIPGQPSDERLDGLHVIRVGGVMKRTFTHGYASPLRQFAWVPSGAGYLLKHAKEYDLIHAHVQASMLAALLGAGSRKLVWSWHGTYHQQLWRMYPAQQALFYEVAEHIAVKLPYAACITGDAYTKKLAMRHMGANPARLFPVENGVDTEMFRPMTVGKPEGWPDGFCLVTTRRLVPKNGLQFLIPALKPIVEKDRDVHLMIYGDGPDRRKLEALSDGNGLSGNVHFMGPAPLERMPSVYSAADAVVIPSLIEATSLSCLEAMACGKALVTCPVGGVPEIAPPDKVIYTEPGNVASLTKGLERVIEMGAEGRETLGRKAREHVSRNFTWKHTVDKILDVYGKVLKDLKGS